MITLYQFQSCPFCSKVRALLTYINQPFTTVEVSPYGKKELDFTDHKKVPVLKDGETIVTESAKIIEYVNEHYAKFSVDDDAKKWTHWIDNTLVHYLPPLVHPSFSQSFNNLGMFMSSNQYGWFKRQFLRFAGALIMPKVARKMTAKHNIKNVKEEYLHAIAYWTESGLNGKQFYGTDKPDYVDCSVFGVLNSCHDLAPIQLAVKNNNEFAVWYERCQALMVEKSTIA